ncbi:MAG: SUMF1/EgtB/PvdO family nonheme iron enzyme, partial [Crocinitomicaceae bacterium]
STTEPFDAFQGRSYDPEKMDASDTLRVIIGGSFLCQKGHCEGYRPEARQSSEQSEAYFHIGFRVVQN